MRSLLAIALAGIAVMAPAAGRHLDGFGAKWHLVAPDGSVIDDRR